MIWFLYFIIYSSSIGPCDKLRIFHHLIYPGHSDTFLSIIIIYLTFKFGNSDKFILLIYYYLILDKILTRVAVLCPSARYIYLPKSTGNTQESEMKCLWFIEVVTSSCFSLKILHLPTKLFGVLIMKTASNLLKSYSSVSAS